jgi:hypothetical protein
VPLGRIGFALPDKILKKYNTSLQSGTAQLLRRSHSVWPTLQMGAGDWAAPVQDARRQLSHRRSFVVNWPA